MEFVALGVTAEIIVIVEQKDAAAAAALRAVEMRGGKPADAGADDDEIVALAGVLERWRRLAVAQRVGSLEGARMTAAHAGEERRVIAGRILSRRRGTRQVGVARQQSIGAGQGGGADGDTIQEIASSNGLVEAQSTVSGFIFLLHDFPMIIREMGCDGGCGKVTRL